MNNRSLKQPNHPCKHGYKMGVLLAAFIGNMPYIGTYIAVSATVEFITSIRKFFKIYIECQCNTLSPTCG